MTITQSTYSFTEAVTQAELGCQFPNYRPQRAAWYELLRVEHTTLRQTAHFCFIREQQRSRRPAPLVASRGTRAAAAAPGKAARAGGVTTRGAGERCWGSGGSRASRRCDGPESEFIVFLYCALWLRQGPSEWEE